MLKDSLLNPGIKAPDSGQYQIVGPNGGKTKYGEITSEKGNPLPPTPERKLKYKPVDMTKHRKK